ncbi:unnamed protein product [Cunninghamella echinulata]
MVVSLIWNIFRHYKTTRIVGDTDYLQLPTTNSSSLLRRTLLMLIFVLLESSTWAFLFAWRLESLIWNRNSIDHDTALYETVAPGLALLPRIYIIILILKSFTTPTDPVSPSKFSLYNPHFLIFYTIFVVSAILRCFSDFILSNNGTWTSLTIESTFALVNLCTNWILWMISATTSTELNQGELLDFDDTDVGVMVLHDGRVVRNGRILSLEASASPLSCITFGWINSLLHSTLKYPLTSELLWALPLTLRSQENDLHFRRFTTQFITPSNQRSSSPSSPSSIWTLANQLYKANSRAAMIQFVTAIGAVLFHYSIPYFLQHLLHFLQNPQGQPNYTGYLYCLAIFSCSILSTLVASQTLIWGRRWYVSLSNMLHTNIYAFTLKAPNGKINDLLKDKKFDNDNIMDQTTIRTNENIYTANQDSAKLIHSDIERLAELASHLHIFYTCPLEIITGVIFLYNILGYAFFVGLIIMTVTLPITHIISRKLNIVQKQLGEAKSWRIQLLRGFFNGIRTTKFLAWESKWEQMIMAARGDELVQLIKLYSQNALLGLIWFATPVFVATISFAWYTLVQKNKLDASTAFVSVVLFGMLRDPLNIMPQAFVAYHEAKISLYRMCCLMDINNTNDDTESVDNTTAQASYNIHHRSYEEQGKVGFIGGTLEIDLDHQQILISPQSTSSNNRNSSSNLSIIIPTFDFPIGKLSVIVGPNNSGKTTLLNTLLGENKLNFNGRAILPSRYLSSPQANYMKDIHNPTLFMFKVAYVPQTPWLETGNIRNNILFCEPWNDARYRLVLHQCDLIRDLMCFENGDLTPVGENGQNISEAIKRKISLARAMFSSAKTVIIDDIFSSLDEKVAKILLKRCTPDSELMKGRTIIISTTCNLESWARQANLVVRISSLHAIDVLKQEAAISEIITETSANNNMISQLSTIDAARTRDYSTDGLESILEFDGGENIQHVIDEEFDAGSVMRDSIIESDGGSQSDVYSRDLAYTTYFTACGGWGFWSTAALLAIFARISSIGESYWLKEGFGSLTEQQYIYIYLGLSIITVVFNFIRTIIQYRGSLRASHRLFLGLLKSVCHAPLQFFEVTSTKDIMLVFSKDVETVDTNLGLHVSFLIQTIVGIVGIIITIGIIVPQFFIVVFFAGLLYCLYGATYIRASHRLKKIESDSRPLVYKLYKDTLDGLITIRAYGKQRQMLGKMYQVLDDNMRPFYLLWATNRWLFVRVEFIGASLCLFLSLFLVYQREKIDVGLAGIALTLAASLLEYVYWLMRQSTAVDMHFDAVQHINEYITIPQEPPGVLEGSRPPAAWPTSAAIQVRDLMIGTVDECILKHVSFTVLPGEKLALIGGGERNSLVLCLFRFIDPIRGSIKIDGVNIAWIGIEDLRSRITYIAKDSNFIGDTIRSNLDPFSEYDDYELWQALYRVHLASPEDEVHGGLIQDLDMPISLKEFSIGDRQLLALARAFLRDATKLIVIEESDDHLKIARIIEEELMDSTIIFVAHQLQHTLNYDRVFVFDQEDLVEIGRPMELLNEPNSRLRALFNSS